jgi:hypothetical protein
MMKKNKFTREIEKLIKPIDVGTLHFIQNINGALPIRVQKKLINNTAKLTPYMGFVVEPYSSFLFYEIKDVEYASSVLPDGFVLEKTAIIDDDVKKFYGVFGVFNAHTSGFWGTRVEYYVIAKDLSTGLLSWVIVDYDTNTISYDPKNGLRKPNADGSIFTVDFDGLIQGEFFNHENGRELDFNIDYKSGHTTGLDNRLWIEGNLSVGYSKILSDEAEVFSLKFDPHEFDSAIEVPLDHVDVIKNSWFEGMFEETPEKVLVFPYAQHYISDSPGAHSKVHDEDELVSEISKIDFEQVNSFTAKPIVRMLFIGAIVSFIINMILLYFALN